MRHLPAIVAVLCLAVALSIGESAPRVEAGPDLAFFQVAEREPGELERAGRSLDEWRALVDRRLDGHERGITRHAHALQEHLREHGAGEEPPVDPPPPDPPPPDPPPATRPPPEPPPPASDWPVVPEIAVLLDERGATPAESVTFPARAAEWTREPGWRFSVAFAEVADLAVFVWREQWVGWNATRSTVAIVNGFEGRGVAHLERLQVLLAGGKVLDRAEHDAIDPRRPLLRRYWSGPQADALRAWQHVEPAGPTLDLLRPLFEQARVSAAAGAKKLGPFELADPEVVGSGSLDGSHGGWKIPPYYGGPDGSVATCREGLRWHGEEWLRVAMRSPIATLERETGRWFNPVRRAREKREAAIAAGDQNPPPAPGAWGGATVAHEPPGYAIVHVPTDGGEWQWPALDGWCAYEGALRDLRYHDHTHYRRTFAAAATVAKWDAPARWFLGLAWGNLALGLDGAPSENFLLQWLPQMLETTPAGVGDSRAGRGWGQTLGCYLTAEPYLPAELRSPSWGGTWREALAELTRHWAMPANGWTHAEVLYYDAAGKAYAGFPEPSDWWWSHVDPGSVPWDARSVYPAGREVAHGGALWIAASKSGPGTPAGAVAPGPAASAWKRSKMQGPIAASRELDLVGVWLEPLGLPDLAAKWRASLAPVRLPGGTWRSVGEHLEVRPNAAHWTELHSRNLDAQPQYDLFRGDLGRSGGVEGLIAATLADPLLSPNELLLDNLPRQVWQAALR